AIALGAPRARGNRERLVMHQPDAEVKCNLNIRIMSKRDGSGAGCEPSGDLGTPRPWLLCSRWDRSDAGPPHTLLEVEETCRCPIMKPRRCSVHVRAARERRSGSDRPEG